MNRQEMRAELARLGLALQEQCTADRDKRYGQRLLRQAQEFSEAVALYLASEAETLPDLGEAEGAPANDAAAANGGPLTPPDMFRLLLADAKIEPHQARAVGAFLFYIGSTSGLAAVKLIAERGWAGDLGEELPLAFERKDYARAWLQTLALTLDAFGLLDLQQPGGSHEND